MIGIRVAAVLTVFTLLFALPTAALLWMTSVPGRSHEGPLPPLTAEQGQMATRLEQHVRAVATEPHNIAHPEALERSALYIEGALAQIGYKVARQPFDADGQSVRNIEAVIEPAAANARTLVIGAHYDSYSNSPGANDNGSGTAAALEMARLLFGLRGKSSLRIRLVFFVNEEPPYFRTERMGSLVYARRLKRSNEPVLGMFSLETLGYYSDARHSQHYPWPLSLLYPDTGDFVAFAGELSSRSFVRSTIGSFRTLGQFPSEGGTAPGMLQGITWSDHWSFGQVGIPALMITDTAPFRYRHYHSPEDTPEKVDYVRLARVVSGLARVTGSWARDPVKP